MELEQKLVDLVFGPSPIANLGSVVPDEFNTISTKQFVLFYQRLVKRIEERLSDQFGASLGLIEENFKLDSNSIATRFCYSPEYRWVREDLDEISAHSNARFEIAFMNFVVRKFEHAPAFLTEFSPIYLAELTIDQR